MDWAGYIKNLNWQETDQLAMYKHRQGVEPGTTVPLANPTGGQNETWFQVQRADH